MALSPEYVRTSLQSLYGTEFTAADVRAWCLMNDTNYQTVTNKLTDYKVGRGKWNLEVTQKKVDELETSYNGPAALPAIEQNLIPAKDASFVSFGNFSDIKKIIKSGLFYPTFITGLSGNGKTFSVEQACAQLGRELIRVNITVETDEDDLIGGFRLVNGETVWHNGPVIEALQRGAVLLLDEIDLASNKILCLQSILEGKGVFLKKIGKFITPAEGFQVFATANKIIFICFYRDVDTNKFPTQLSTRLFNRESLTVTGQTCNERWIEYTGLNNFFNIAEIAKADEGIIFTGNEVLFYCRHCCRSTI